MPHQYGLFKLHGVNKTNQVFHPGVSGVRRRGRVRQAVAACVYHIDVVAGLQFLCQSGPAKPNIGNTVGHHNHRLAGSGDRVVVVDADSVGVHITVRPPLGHARRCCGTRRGDHSGAEDGRQHRFSKRHRIPLSMWSRVVLTFTIAQLNGGQRAAGSAATAGRLACRSRVFRSARSQLFSAFHRSMSFASAARRSTAAATEDGALSRVTLLVYSINCPPFTSMVSPTTKLAASEARKAFAVAYSTGTPTRPSGMMALKFRIISGVENTS